MKITDKCTFSDGGLHNLKAPVAEGDTKIENRSDQLCSPNIGTVTRSLLVIYVSATTVRKS
jgi:hypothetical protein